MSSASWWSSAAWNGAFSGDSCDGSRHAPDSATRAIDSICSTVKTSSRAAPGSLRLTVAEAGFAVSCHRDAFSGPQAEIEDRGEDLAVLVHASRADALARVRDEDRFDVLPRRSRPAAGRRSPP